MTIRRNALAIALTILGAAVLCYPFVADYLSRMHASFVIDQYNDSVQQKDNQEIEREIQKAIDYNENLLGKSADDSPINHSDKIREKTYLEILNINGVIGHLEIPKIKVKLPIYHGVSNEVLRKGVGHLEGTSLPIGGKGTHAVLTGHTGLPSARLLSDAKELTTGDVFFVGVMDRRLAYQVDQVKVVEPNAVDDLRIVPDQDFVTLVTCTPYSVNSHRLLIRGHRVDYNAAKTEAANVARMRVTREAIMMIVALAVVLLMIIFVVIAKTRKTSKSTDEPGDRAPSS